MQDPAAMQTGVAEEDPDSEPHMISTTQPLACMSGPVLPVVYSSFTRSRVLGQHSPEVVVVVRREDSCRACHLKNQSFTQNVDPVVNNLQMPCDHYTRHMTTASASVITGRMVLY